MDIRYLKSLLAVIDSGSIADAARREHLTAAAVGQRIQALERDLEVSLLLRTGHTAQPTQACLALVPRARRLLRDAALLKSDASGEGAGDVLRLGAVSTALTGLLPKALKALTQTRPGARPVIVPGVSRELYQGLQKGELDAAIVVAPPFDVPRALRATVVRREPLVCLAPPDSRGRAPALLKTYPYIRYDPQAWGGRHAQAWLDDQGLAPSVLCDLDALEAIALLVSDGMGVALVPHWAGIERFTGQCRILPVPGDSYKREIVLLSSADPDLAEGIATLEASLSSVA